MATTILITDITKLKFDFQTTPGSVIISYPGVSSITVSSWRQWYTYTSAGKLYFVDTAAAGTAGTTVSTIQNNPNLTMSVGSSGSTYSLIGNGDARPAGRASINITNDSSTPTLYANVLISGTQVQMTKP